MERQQKIIVASDVDRCLLNTETAFRLAKQATAEETALSIEEIDVAYADHKKNKQSFNVVGFIERWQRQHKTKKTWDQHILPAFIEEGRNTDLLMPGADEYLDTIEELGLPHFLLTYGSWSNEVADPGLDRERSIKWQLGKIAASERLSQMATHVAETPEKSRLISRDWTHSVDGQKKIILPTDLYEEFSHDFDQLILTDDKPVAFDGADLDVMAGIQVTPESLENRTAHLETDLALAGIHRVVGLREAAKALREITSDR